MNDPIDFYFDFASPYAYFASTRIDELAARHGRTVRWHPVLLAVFFKVTGGRPGPTVPVLGPYMVHDMARTARLHGIPFRMPALPPPLLLGAPRAMLWLQREHGDALAVAFAKRCLAAYHSEGVDIGKEEAVLRIGVEVGADPDALAQGMHSEAIKEALKEECNAALAKGVFGVPFVLADGEPFWGFDRFDQLEGWLQAAAKEAAA